MSEAINFEPTKAELELQNSVVAHGDGLTYAPDFSTASPDIAELTSGSTETTHVPCSSRVRKVAALVLATAATLGAPQLASAQTIETPGKIQLRQIYEGYTSQFPNPVYVKPLADFYNPGNADYVCANPRQVLGQVTYKFNPKNGEFSGNLERKSSMYADEVVMTADPTPGPQTREDQVWEKLALNCPSLIDLHAKMQFFKILPAQTKSGKKVKEWKRVPGTASVDLPDWQPNAVRNQTTDDPAINVPLLRNDTFQVKPSRRLSSKQLTGSEGVYPTIVLESSSRIADYRMRTAVVLGKLLTTQRTINAGSKYFGKGGALTNVATQIK